MKKFHLFLGILFALAIAGTQVIAAEPAAAEKPWSVRCNKDEKGKEISEPKRGNCEIFQRLVVKDTGQRFVEVAIGFPKEKESARGIIVVPLGILLQPGMSMKIDGGKEYKFQARYCDNNGCFGYVDLNDALLESLRKGSKLTVSFQALNKKQINVEVTLKDFATSLTQVS
jgi:invasion protein IalB